MNTSLLIIFLSSQKRLSGLWARTSPTQSSPSPSNSLTLRSRHSGAPFVLLANEMCNLIGFLPLYFFFSVCPFVQGCGRSCRLPSVEADPRAGRRSVGLQHWTRVFFRKEVRAADYIYISLSLQQFHIFGRCRPNMRGQGRVTSNQSCRNKFSFPLHIRCFLKSLIFNLVFFFFFFLLDSLQ